jgi:hypothetical protein
MGLNRYYSIVLKALAVLSLAAAAPVCSIPVFRYALERWRAAPYGGVLFHQGPLSPEARKLLAELEGSGLNVYVEPVDVAKPLGDDHKALWEAEKAQPLPRLVISYPNQPEAVAWRGLLAPSTLRALIDSPRRKETDRLLTTGTSVVWWFFESGVAAKDEAALALMSKELSRLEKEIKIPIPGPDDPPLRSAVPLKVAFTLLRVPANAEAEAPFLETLQRARRDWALPAVIPIFGRGRALGSLCGEEINADHVSRMAEYVTDACSCEVKELNPGVDLLFAADWDGLLDAPPLAPEPVKAEPEPLQLPAPPPPPAAPPAPPASPTSPAPSRHLLWAGLGVAALVALVAGAAAFRKGA